MIMHPWAGRGRREQLALLLVSSSELTAAEPAAAARGSLPTTAGRQGSHSRCIGPDTIKKRGTPCTFPLPPQGD
jgi:hypothetical protein